MRLAATIVLSIFFSACSSETQQTPQDSDAKGIVDKAKTAAGLGEDRILKNPDESALQLIASLSPEITAAANEYQISEKVIQAILYRELALHGWNDRAQDYFSKVFRKFKEDKASGVKQEHKNIIGKLWNMTKSTASNVLIAGADDLTKLWKVSFGIAQFQPHTFQSMVKAGAYVPKTQIDINDLYSVLEALNNEKLAPFLIAAQVRQSINSYNLFREKEISQRVDILGTLYTLGAAGKVDPKTGALLNTEPDRVPEPNDAGKLIGNIANDIFKNFVSADQASSRTISIVPGCHSFKGEVPLFKDLDGRIYDYTLGNGTGEGSAIVFLKYYDTKDGLSQVTIHNLANNGNLGYLPDNVLKLARLEHRFIKISDNHCAS